MARDGDFELRSGMASLYVNYFEIAHSRHEFLLELGQFRPGGTPGDGTLAIHTSLAVPPAYARMLSDVLSRAVSAYERAYGRIDPLDPLDGTAVSAADPAATGRESGRDPSSLDRTAAPRASDTRASDTRAPDTRAHDR